VAQLFSLGSMTTPQTFRPARLFFGLFGVSIVCYIIASRAWTTEAFSSLYILLLLLPTVGYGLVFYWSQMFAGWSVAQRLLIALLFAPLLALGFMFVVICLRFTF